MVGRNDVPRCPRRARSAERLFVRALIRGPKGAFGDIGDGELPRLVGRVDACEEPFALLIVREVQEELQDDGTVAREVMLEGVDVLEAMAPELRCRSAIRREILAREHVGVHARDDQLFVIGAVEDADAPAWRQRVRTAPQVVVCELVGRGHLEAGHVDALGVDARQHVLDRAVLPRRIHPLQDDEQRVCSRRGEHVLQRGELRDVGGELGFGVLLRMEAAGRRRVERVELQLTSRLHEQPRVVDRCHTGNTRGSVTRAAAMQRSAAP